MNENRAITLKLGERQITDESYVDKVIDLLSEYHSKDDSDEDNYTYIDGIKLVF